MGLDEQSQLAGGKRHQAQRVAAKINERFAVLVSRQSEVLAIRAQGIGFVERARVIECRLVRHAGPYPTLQPARSMTVPQRVHVRRSRFA